MKNFKVTYISYDGVQHIVRKVGYDQDHVKKQLINCKEVISCEELITEEENT